MKENKIGIPCNPSSTVKDNEQHMKNWLESMNYKIEMIPLSSSIKKQLNTLKECSHYYKVGTIDNWKFLPFILLFTRVKVVLHWIGTDALLYDTNKFVKFFFNFITFFFKKRIIHVAVSSNLIEELNSGGIKADSLPIIPDGMEELSNKNKKEKQVVSYIPQNRLDFYSFDKLYSCCKLLPEYNFVIIGMNQYPDGFDELSNLSLLEFQPYEKLMEIIDSSEYLIRYTFHDGLPKMILEAFMLETKVIFNHKMEPAFCADNINDIVECIKGNKISTENIRSVAIDNYGYSKVKKLYKSVFGEI